MLKFLERRRGPIPFWILDWGMPEQLTVPEIEIMQVQTKMVSDKEMALT